MAAQGVDLGGELDGIVEVSPPVRERDVMAGARAAAVHQSRVSCRPRIPSARSRTNSLTEGWQTASAPAQAALFSASLSRGRSTTPSGQADGLIEPSPATTSRRSGRRPGKRENNREAAVGSFPPPCVRSTGDSRRRGRGVRETSPPRPLRLHGVEPEAHDGRIAGDAEQAARQGALRSAVDSAPRTLRNRCPTICK